VAQQSTNNLAECNGCYTVQVPKYLKIVSWYPRFLSTLTLKFIREIMARHWPKNTHPASRGSLRSLFQGVLKTLLLIKFNLIFFPPLTVCRSSLATKGAYRGGVEVEMLSNH
jgi:hypothetical protein